MLTSVYQLEKNFYVLLDKKIKRRRLKSLIKTVHLHAAYNYSILLKTKTTFALLLYSLNFTYILCFFFLLIETFMAPVYITLRNVILFRYNVNY